jgi:DMSO reductase anchor subunit
VKPAFSVLFFTVSSGAGLGLAAWLIAAQLAQRIDPSQPVFWVGAVVAALLLTFGLLASTRHLANPRNAWRAFARVRTSWLSREGVLAVAFYPLAALHLWASAAGSAVAVATGVATIALAAAIVACTAMIYACLKTVPRWRTWHVPASYLLYAAASGALLWRALAGAGSPSAPSAPAAFALVAAAAAIKALYFVRFAAPVTATINEALAVPEAAAAGRVGGRVRLLDPGHAHATFLTNEFGFALARERAAGLRATMFGLTFAVPAASLLVPAAGGFAWLGAMAFLAGALVERWLFFAQAEHVVRLYHGQARV